MRHLTEYIQETLLQCHHIWIEKKYTPRLKIIIPSYLFCNKRHHCQVNLNRQASVPIIAVLVSLNYCNRKDNSSTRNKDNYRTETYLPVTCCIFSQLHQCCTFCSNMLHTHRQTIRNERRKILCPYFILIDTQGRNVINTGLM